VVDTDSGLLMVPAGRMASMARTRRSFTPDYRVEAAHRVIDTDRTIAQVARDIGVGEQLLGRWVRDERARESAATARANTGSVGSIAPFEVLTAAVPPLPGQPRVRSTPSP
jgi:transposase-like protein